MQAVAANITGEASSGFPHHEWVIREMQAVLAHRLALLRRSAYRLLGDQADAEDAVQDALLSAYRHIHQFRGQSQMATWLNAIVQNSARMKLRSRPRQSHESLDENIGQEQEYSLKDLLADPRPSPEEECRTLELKCHFARQINRLAPVLRKTLQLSEFQDLSIPEIAITLGVPIGTVKAQLSRGRAKLRKSMGQVLTSKF